MLADATSHPVWMVHCSGVQPEKITRFQALGVTLLDVPEKDGHIDPTAALAALAGQGITRVFCEGGGALAASLIRAKLVDMLVVMQAGKLIGADGLPSLGPFGLATLAAAPHLELHAVERLGEDVAQFWTVKRNGSDRG